MPLYVYSCTCGPNFEVFQPVTGVGSAECPGCTRVSDKRVPQALAVLNTKNQWELNTYESRTSDTAHHCRMMNKKSLEENWHKVESGECDYDPGLTPKAYQPRQHVERSEKKLY